MNEETPAPPPPRPITANFPDPRKNALKPTLREKPSVDAIIQRTNPTNPTKRKASDLVYLGVEDCYADLEAEEFALKEKERELARKRAEAEERIRVVQESEILIKAREKVLDERERTLTERLTATTHDTGMAALEKALKDTRHLLSDANSSLSEKDEVIAALRTEMAELKAAQESMVPVQDDSPVTGYEQVTHKSLADQVAFLREREEFIEQSENTLFDKAQQLQEWETRLQQQEHDVSSNAASNAEKEDSMESHTGSSPIEFPRTAHG